MSMLKRMNLPMPLKVPRSMIAAMSLIMLFVTQGYRWWTRGQIPYRKLANFITKMETNYGVLTRESARQHHRARGKVTAHLVVYPGAVYPDDEHPDAIWCWWLLFCGKRELVEAVAAENNETLLDCYASGQQLRWREDYVLQQRPRTGDLSWLMTPATRAAVESELISLVVRHGKGTATINELETAILRLRHRPMHGGVRDQSSALLFRMREVWARTHSESSPLPRGLCEPLPILFKQPLYDPTPRVILPR